MLACMESPQPGVTTTTVVSAADAISTSIWPTPTVSTMTTRDAGRTEQAHGVGHGQGEPAEVAPRRHGPDEHGRVEGVLAHAHAVAQDRPPAEGRGRVDGQDAHLRDRLGVGPGPTRPRLADDRPSVSVDLPAPGAPVSPTV